MKRREFLAGTIGTAVIGSMAVLGPIQAATNPCLDILLPGYQPIGYNTITVSQVMNKVYDMMNEAIDRMCSEYAIRKGQIAPVIVNQSKYSFIAKVLWELHLQSSKDNKKLLLIVRKDDFLWKRGDGHSYLPSPAFGHIVDKIMFERDDGSFHVAKDGDRRFYPWKGVHHEKA